MRRAEQAEKLFDPQSAATLYRAARDADPKSRMGRRATIRLEWLEARSEAEFVPLAKLMRVRGEANSIDRARLEKFEAELASFPAGRVRREARAFVADAWLRKVGDPARALEAYETWLAEPGLDRGERELAESGAALSRVALGKLDRSLSELRAAGLGRSAAAALVIHARLRKTGRPLAFGLIFGFIVLGAALGGFRGFRPAALRSALGPQRLALGAYALLGPLILAQLHSREAAHVVEAVVFPAGLLLALAALFGAGLDRAEASRRTRFAVAALGVLAQLGVAFLGIDRSGMLLALLTA